MAIMGVAMPKKSRIYNFTSRRNTFGNYWLSYSNKTGAILQLASDRELAHWLLNLEFNPAVKFFKFDNFTTKELTESGIPDLSFRVMMKSSCGVEYHRISSVKDDSASLAEKSIANSLWQIRHIKYCHYSDADFNARRSWIYPLFRLSGFLTSCKDQYVSPLITEAIGIYIRQLRRGTLQKYLSDQAQFNSQIFIQPRECKALFRFNPI